MRVTAPVGDPMSINATFAPGAAPRELPPEDIGSFATIEPTT